MGVRIVFSGRRRIIAGLRSQLSVNGEIVYECTMWERHPPILHTLRRFWRDTGPDDFVVLRLIYRTRIVDYVRSNKTGSFEFFNQRKTTEDERQQYSNGFMPGLDGGRPYRDQTNHDQKRVQEYPFGTCILFE